MMTRGLVGEARLLWCRCVEDAVGGGGRELGRSEGGAEVAQNHVCHASLSVEVDDLDAGGGDHCRSDSEPSLTSDY